MTAAAPLLLLAIAASVRPPVRAGPGSPHRFFVRVEAAESLQVTTAGEGDPVVLIPGLFAW